MKTAFPFIIFLLWNTFPAPGQSLTPAQETDSLLTACDSLYRLGQWREALALAETTLATQRPQVDAGTPAPDRMLNTLGQMQTAMGRYAAAEKTFLEAKTRQELRGDTASESYSATLSGLGLNWLEMARYDEAEPLLVKAREITLAR